MSIIAIDTISYIIKLHLINKVFESSFLLKRLHNKYKWFLGKNANICDWKYVRMLRTGKKKE